jgi:ubiquitin-protein ligase E3 A
VIDIAAGSTSSAVILSFYPHVIPLPSISFPPTLSSYGITHFDLSTFNHLIESSRQNSSYAPLLAYINRIFSSPSVLNASFLPLTSLPPSSSLLQRQLSLSSIDPLVAATTLPNSLLAPAYRRSPPPIAEGIDTASLEQVYTTILKESIAEPKLISQVSHAIRSCIHSMVERAKQPHPLADAAAYRAVAICLQAPFLSAASASDIQLLADIAQVVGRMTVSARKVMRRNWSSYPADIFGSRLVKMIVTGITSQLYQQRLSLASTVPAGHPVPRIVQISEEVQQMVKLLALMKEASDLAGGLIGDERWFINVGKYISLEDDFIRFIQRPATQAMLPPFSFCRYAFTLDPATKSAYLRLEQFSHQRSSIYAAINSEQQPFAILKVERSRLVESTIYGLNAFSAYELQRPLKVEFVGEEGVDQGGVSAEFFRLVVTELCSKQYGLFDYNEELRHLWWNAEQADPSKIDLYYLAGTLFGLAAYNAHSINVSFPAIFYKQLLTTPIDSPASSSTSFSLADLHSLDPRLVQSLQQLLAYDAPDLEDVFQLSFTVDQQVRKKGKDGEELIEIHTAELIEGGAKTPVTQANKLNYISLLTTFILSSSIHPQQQSFIRGFRSVCQGRSMQMFTPSDLQLLLIGQPSWDWKALRQSARYEGGYTRETEVVKWLWEVMDELTQEERLKLLLFVTGSSRAPLGGLGELRIVVQKNGGDSEQVPTASTCFATLLLPEYSSKEKLAKKLRTALEHSEGFGLQ